MCKSRWLQHRRTVRCPHRTCWSSLSVTLSHFQTFTISNFAHPPPNINADTPSSEIGQPSMYTSLSAPHFAAMHFISLSPTVSLPHTANCFKPLQFETNISKHSLLRFTPIRTSCSTLTQYSATPIKPLLPISSMS
ncbi:hypothetical protein VIGAN_02047800, partial [Vigna angularis var. angularis]